MGKNKLLTITEKHRIVELYKSHHTTKEVSTLMNASYSNIATIYHALKLMGTEKYERIDLIPRETFVDLFGDAYDDYLLENTG